MSITWFNLKKLSMGKPGQLNITLSKGTSLIDSLTSALGDLKTAKLDSRLNTIMETTIYDMMWESYFADWAWEGQLKDDVVIPVFYTQAELSLNKSVRKPMVAFVPSLRLADYKSEWFDDKGASQFKNEADGYQGLQGWAIPSLDVVAVLHGQHQTDEGSVVDAEEADAQDTLFHEFFHIAYDGGYSQMRAMYGGSEDAVHDEYSAHLATESARQIYLPIHRSVSVSATKSNIDFGVEETFDDGWSFSEKGIFEFRYFANLTIQHAIN